MLAIDPGPVKSAWAYLHPDKLYHGILPNELMLNKLETVLAVAIKQPWAIEMVQCFGMPVGEDVFQTVLWIGRFTQLAVDFGGQVPKFIFRSQVKMHLCNSTRAKDPNIRQALIDRFGNPGTKKSPGYLYGVSKDVWSALAVAVTASNSSQNEKAAYGENER